MCLAFVKFNKSYNIILDPSTVLNISVQTKNTFKKKTLRSDCSKKDKNWNSYTKLMTTNIKIRISESIINKIIINMHQLRVYVRCHGFAMHAFKTAIQNKHKLAKARTFSWSLVMGSLTICL